MATPEGMRGIRGKSRATVKVDVGWSVVSRDHGASMLSVTVADRQDTKTGGTAVCQVAKEAADLEERMDKQGM